jgi:GT2 family glycosyltransferase
MRPWLSVLMPVYNGGAYLTTALESVAAQGDRNLEVIVVDDGSSDDSLRILRGFQDRLPLRIVEQSHSGSWVRRTNDALAMAQGDYVSLLHQDDVWHARRLKVLRASTEQYAEAGMHFHPAFFIDSNGDRVARWNAPLRTGQYAAGELHERLLVQNFIAVPTPIVRRETALEVGGLDDRLWYTADWDFWLKVSQAAPVVYHPEPLAEFRIHADSQTVRRSACGEDFRNQLLLAYEPHGRRWEALYPQRRGVNRVAQFSIEVNTALARMAHGGQAGLGRLAWQFLKLGPPGWRRYFRDSRIIDRVGARMRLKSRFAARRRQPT